jgi:photosystem II stability/assembly factor-like uncharacterized protein
VYAGTHAGVFRSGDGGRSWENAARGLPGAPVRGFAVSAEDPEVVLAATDAGLYRTEDAGRSWRRASGAGVPALPTRVSMDPGVPARVYLGTRGGGVLRSDDGGASFLRTTLGSGEVRALAVDPRDHVVWAATEHGLFRSGDRGFRWTPVAGIPDQVLALAIDAEGPSTRLFAATAGHGLHASHDGGASWHPTKLESGHLTDVVVSPGARGRILASSPDGVFSSTDGGNSWKLARVGPIEALASLGPDAWAAGGPRGILRADSAGKGWTESNAGLAAASVFSLAALDGPRTVLVAGTAHGILRLDEGKPWTRLLGTPDASEFYSVVSSSADLLVGSSGEIGRSFGLDGSWSWLPAPAVFGLTVDPARPGRAFAATRGATLRSEDGGLTWQASAEGLSRTFPLQLAVDLADASIVYAATAGSGVFRSTNGGRSWKPYGPELSRAIVRCVAGDSISRLYAGTDRGVFASPAGARSWSALAGGLPRSPVYALLVDPESPGRLFAGTGEGLFFTRNAGETWLPIAAGELRAPVTSLLLDRSRRRLYAGTLGAGVFAVGLPE